MKTYRIIWLCALLTLVGKAHADNVSVGNVTIKEGETKEVAITLKNPDTQYAAFQFDLVLPEGISVAKDSKGKFIYHLNEDRIDDHTLSVVEKSGGVYRFLSFSMSNSELYENDGALVYVTLKAEGTVGSRTKTCTITSQVFTTTEGTQHKLEDAPFQITIPSSAEDGDVNGDGTVNISDVTALVNIILGKGSDENGMADVNGDGTVNISDVTALVNIILGKQ